jgi:hypothetical protein
MARAATTSDTFNAVAEPRRREILSYLALQERPVWTSWPAWGSSSPPSRSTGPLFMSFAVVSNVQYRLTEVDGGTLITLRHSARGFIPAEHREEMPKGWTTILARFRQQAEAKKPGR